MIKIVQSGIKFCLPIFILFISSLLGKAYAVLPIQEIELSNGSKAYLVQATTIPMIEVFHSKCDRNARIFPLVY